MSNKSAEDENPKPAFWEDSIILAFRDLQWIQKHRDKGALNKSLASAANAAKEVGGDKNSWVECLSQQLMQPPPLLAKLDGNAESASGDVLTSIKKNFFLFEFKANRNAVRTEKSKSVFEKLSTLADDSHPAKKQFLDLSRRGHHVIYPTLPQDVPLGNVTDGFLALHRVTLKSRPYFNAAVLNAFPNDQSDDWMDRELDVINLLYETNQQYELRPGLSLPEMAAYLRFLTDLHDKGEHPMKIVVASSDGFFWPGGSLSALIDIAKYFDRTLDQENTFETKLMAQGIYAKFQSLLGDSPNTDRRVSCDI